ncbi:MAG: U32 family peptidase [Spirochaetales bacterium]|nr:U32 family peptidase [Spirochaetales bacterium]
MSGYYAFEAGADAVYLGLQKFSARERAQNFSQTELLKLKELAVKKNKKIYIALNTIIKDDEFDRLNDELYLLDQIKVDGIIVQDIGLVYVLRRNFPVLRVHASTQMALHTNDGVMMAKEMGVRRIVLPRELDKDTVKDFADRFPDMEFEVFIHGAVCYSFSGVCLASGLLYGRSGNRGECAQLCRCRFEGKNTRDFPFACRDLFSGSRVRELVSCRVKSLKIEGRLKQPNYVFHTVKYYRYIIDTLQEDTDPEKLKTLENNVHYVFSREHNQGKLFCAPAESLIVKKYQRHRGKKAGEVVAATQSGFIFQAEVSISRQDVISVYLTRDEEVPFKIPVREMMVHNIHTEKCRAGDLVTIDSEKIPDIGQEVYKLYSRELELPGIRHDNFDEFKLSLPCRVEVHSDSREMFLSLSFTIYGQQYTKKFTVNTKGYEEKENLQKRISAANLKTMRGIWQLILELNAAGAKEKTTVKIQSKQLISIFKQVYELLQTIQEEEQKQLQKRIPAGVVFADKKELSGELYTFVSDRTNLNPRSSRTTFVSAGTKYEELAEYDGTKFISLPPVMLTDDIKNHVREIILLHPDTRFLIGLNNIGHLALCNEFSSSANVVFFVDYFLYIANRYTMKFLSAISDKIQFGYYWIEGKIEEYTCVRELSAFPIVFADLSFTPPLFVRAGDFSLESMLDGVVPEMEQFCLENAGKKFTVSVENKVTYIFSRKQKDR